ncbi:hypothetical protein [Actinoplanes sp. NPDC049118]|uniref:hypothetical protein n=1 Tax=Actinoplanes sp. NPDC049118 TaxID=3155769 RepID=UPI0034034014
MTMPAEVTSATDWDRLVTTLRAQYGDIDDLYQRITDPEADEQQEPEEDDIMTDPYTDAERQAEVDDRAAEYADEERVRLDAETDGRVDGDYDIDPYDEPGLDA